jgi:hypothetical protein
MREEFTHIVLTRFNTAVGYSPSAKRLDSEWLTGRLKLFRDYCLPSMQGQRGASFHWLIFLDAASPAWFKREIEFLKPLVEPVYVDGSLTDEVMAEKVAATGFVTTPYLVTTRLDNDDALAIDHLANVQSAFQRQEREFLVFPFGLQSFRDQLYTVFWPSNPFLSLIEKVQSGTPFTTVHCVEHNRVRQAGRVKSIFRSPQWLQILHSSNVLNTLRGWPRLQSRTHPNFPVAWPQNVAADSLPSRLTFSAQVYGARAARLFQKATAVLK